jgi:hypothetical protein
MSFFRLAFRAERRLFFFDFVDSFLQESFQGVSNEFSTVLDGEGFGVVEDVSVGCVGGGDFHLVEVGGGLFEKKFASSFRRAILAGSHGDKGVRVKLKFTNFTYITQSRNWGLTHPCKSGGKLLLVIVPLGLTETQTPVEWPLA